MAIAVAIVIVCYAVGIVLIDGLVANKLVAQLSLPPVERKAIDFGHGGPSGLALHYQDAGQADDARITDLTSEFNLAWPFAHAWNFNVESKDVVVSNVSIQGSLRPWGEKPFDLRSASVESIRSAGNDDFVVSGARTQKYVSTNAPRYYVFEVSSIELGGLSADVGSVLGKVLRDIKLNVTRKLGEGAGDGRPPPARYSFDWQLGSWGPMQLSGNGTLDLDAEKLSAGKISLSASGISLLALQQALKSDFAAVFVGVLGAICYTNSTDDGLTAEVTIDATGVYLSSQPPCQGLPPIPLQKFDTPIRRDKFDEIANALLY